MKREQSEKRGELAGQRGDILREKEWWRINGSVGGAHAGKKSDQFFFFFLSGWGHYTSRELPVKIFLFFTLS